MISEGSDLPSGVDPAYPYTDAGERSAVLRAQRGLHVFFAKQGNGFRARPVGGAGNGVD